MKEQSQSMHRWLPLTALLLVIALMMLTACQPIQPAANAAAATIPEVTIEVNDGAITVPADFPGGIVRVTLKNNTHQDLDVGFGRLHEGASLEKVKELNQDFMSNVVPLLQMVSIMPGFNPLPAGRSQQMIIDFKTGHFLLDATKHVEGEPQPGATHFYGEFTADKLVGTVEPQADVKVELNDFAFVMPDEIKAGSHLWEYHNTGKQWHMQFLVKPNPDATMDDVMAAFAARGEGSGPPPFEFIPNVGTQPISEGERFWQEVTLEPGTYLAGCLLPDLTSLTAGGPPKSHLAEGMHHLLTVK